MATIAEVGAGPQRRPHHASAAAGRLQTGPLVTAHIWVAIAAFAIACLLGVWQMWARSPLPAPAHELFVSNERDNTVTGRRCGSVVARMNLTCSGGSSSVLSIELNACRESMCTSSMMYTLKRPCCGA